MTVFFCFWILKVFYLLLSVFQEYSFELHVLFCNFAQLVMKTIV